MSKTRSWLGNAGKFSFMKNKHKRKRCAHDAWTLESWAMGCCQQVGSPVAASCHTCWCSPPKTNGLELLAENGGVPNRLEDWSRAIHPGRPRQNPQLPGIVLVSWRSGECIGLGKKDSGVQRRWVPGWFLLECTKHRTRRAKLF